MDNQTKVVSLSLTLMLRDAIFRKKTMRKQVFSQYPIHKTFSA